MDGKSWRVSVLVFLFGLVVLYGTRAADDKPTDEGKAEDFKGKSFDLKEKGEAGIILAFTGGKKATVTVKVTKRRTSTCLSTTPPRSWSPRTTALARTAT